MFDQMIQDIHHWNRISQYFHMNYIKNKISKMSNLGKVNYFSPFQYNADRLATADLTAERKSSQLKVTVCNWFDFADSTIN